jgi:Subtilase family/Secretion system C-terminal sorting domain
MKPNIKTILTLCLLFFILEKTDAQNQESINHSPALATFLKTKMPLNTPVSVVVTDVTAFKAFLKKELPTTKIHFEYPLAKVLIVSDTGGISRYNQEEGWLEQLIYCPFVQFIDQSQKVFKEELKVPGHNLSVNRINAAHADFPTISGKNMTISIKENAFDSSDIDFHGRFVSNRGSNYFLTTHANLMATLIGGAGNSSESGQGVAYSSRLLSTGFNNLFPESEVYFDTLKISVQNNSYGSALESFYGAEAFAYDKLIEAKPTTSIIFSAGNSGTQKPTTGTYTNLAAYANLSGNYKMAKNILVVGSVDSFGLPDPLSSRGPAYDGRIKPDLVAFSPDGTSGAAALVSGSAALVQQAFMDKQKVTVPPSSALVKAVLLNSADDVGAEGIDFITGFGNLNTRCALETVAKGQFMEGQVAFSEKWTATLNVPQNLTRLKATLVWLDPTLSPNRKSALTQDLDFELENKLTGLVYQPWVLNSQPNLDSLKLLPLRKRDSLNNVEQITVELPSAGDYTLRVIGTKVLNPQSFYIVYQFDTAQTFKWTFPRAADAVLAAKTSVLRWETTFKGNKAVLKYKNTEGGVWTAIDSFIIGTERRWQVPNVLETTQLQMDIGAFSFVSDTFFVSKNIDLHIAFNCADSVGLFWNKLSDTMTYQLFALGNQYLEPIKTLRDTFVILSKKAYPTRYITVAPLLKKHFVGIKSPTPDYAQQGVGCYIETFYAELQTDKTVALSLTLATTYNLKKLFFERLENGQFKTLGAFNAHDLTYSMTDAQPHSGRNTYRVRFETQTNQNFVSEEAYVFLLNSEDYLIFPNPVTRNTPLSILSKNLEPKVNFRLFDVFGRIVVEQKLNNNKIDVFLSPDLAEGVYIYRIEKAGKVVATGKILVLQ